MKIPKDLYIWEKDSKKYCYQLNKLVLWDTDKNCIGMTCADPATGENIRPINKAEYVTYKLLGYLDNYEEKRIPRKNVKAKNPRAKKPTKTK